MGRIFVTAANDPPIPPSKLHILVVDNGHVTLEWQDNSTNETGFELQVSTDGGVTWTNLATTPGNQVTRTIEFSANTAENTVARFRVRAANDFGVSSWAAVASTPSDAPKKPSVPNGGKAQASSAQEIVVTWNPAAQATAYRVERALSAKGEWQEVYLGSKTSFADNHGGEGLASSTKYFYRVTAINLSVSSKTSGTFSATTSALPPEGMPDAVEATAESTSRVHVTWKAVNHATQYLVERSTDGATWKKVKTVSIKSPNDLTEAIISGHKPATSYFYRVTASSPAGSSEPSAAVSVTTLLKTPSAPRLTVLGSQSVQLKWVGEKNVAGYRIDRVAENSTVWETIVELDAATKEYLDTTTLPNTVYQYRLVSLGNGVNGENIESHPSRVRKIQTAPPRVERLEAIAVGPRQVTLTWSEAAGATRYLVQHFNGKVWRNAGTTKTTSITVRSLSADSVHRFRVVAVGKDGNADSSSELEIVTPIDVPKTPNALRLFASGPYSATLTWKEAEGADFYRIYRYDTEERNWDMQADEITELAYHDEYLEEKTRYQYRVFAVNASGESLRFASGSVVTLQEPTLALFPDSPEIVSVTKSSVRIAFTAPEAGRQIYRIQWSADGEIWLSEKMYASTQGAVVVSMLRPNTEYFFRIRLEKMNRISDWSPVIYATTLSLFESQKPLPVG